MFDQTQLKTVIFTLTDC